MKVSIITVVFNGGKTIEETILSVYKQTNTDIEYIVIDGASTDDTLSILKRHSDKITHCISEPDRGIYDAMNKGIKIATGEVIGFLNADDIYGSDTTLKKIINVFSNPSIDACYGDLVYISDDNKNKLVRYWKSQNYTDGLCRKGWMPAHPTFYVSFSSCRSPVLLSLIRKTLISNGPILRGDYTIINNIVGTA